MCRQIVARALSRIEPGVTTSGDLGWWVKEDAFKRGLTGYSTVESGPRIYYSPKSERIAPPDARWFIRRADHVLQRGNFFAFDIAVNYMGFDVDDKTHVYIMEEGETGVPERIQYAFDQAIKEQEIIRPHVRVGMTARESWQAMVSAMEDVGYIYTPLTDDGVEDYKEIQTMLANTDKSGFYVDLHSVGNNGFSGLNQAGPSMSPFRPDMLDLTIQENDLFAFEYAVHTNLPDRPGFPISINISNIHIVSSRGVEWLQPPNEEIVVIH